MAKVTALNVPPSLAPAYEDVLRNQGLANSLARVVGERPLDLNSASIAGVPPELLPLWRAAERITAAGAERGLARNRFDTVWAVYQEIRTEQFPPSRWLELAPLGTGIATCYPPPEVQPGGGQAAKLRGDPMYPVQMAPELWEPAPTAGGTPPSAAGIEASATATTTSDTSVSAWRRAWATPPAGWAGLGWYDVPPVILRATGTLEATTSGASVRWLLGLWLETIWLDAAADLATRPVRTYQGPVLLRAPSVVESVPGGWAALRWLFLLTATGRYTQGVKSTATAVALDLTPAATANRYHAGVSTASSDLMITTASAYAHRWTVA